MVSLTVSISVCGLTFRTWVDAKVLEISVTDDKEGNTTSTILTRREVGELLAELSDWMIETVEWEWL